MKLIEYMRTNHIDDAEMADAVGQCSPSAVRKWKYGERTPSLDAINRIRAVTNGRVSFEDFISEAAE